jgi:hypothetical protein
MGIYNSFHPQLIFVHILAHEVKGRMCHESGIYSRQVSTSLILLLSPEINLYYFFHVAHILQIRSVVLKAGQIT